MEAAVEQTFVNKDGVATLKLGQARGEPAGLCPRPRHDHPQPEQRPPLIPRQLLAERRDGADQRDRGRREVGRRLGDLGQRRHHRDKARAAY